MVKQSCFISLEESENCFLSLWELLGDNSHHLTVVLTYSRAGKSLFSWPTGKNKQMHTN